MNSPEKRTRRLIECLRSKQGVQVKLTYDDGTAETTQGFGAVMAAIASGERRILGVECDPNCGTLESIINALLAENPLDVSDIPELNEQ